MPATEFTPIASLAGGVLIGLAAVALMLATGRIAGVSGFIARLVPPYDDGLLAVRVAFAGGLVSAPLLYTLVTGTGVAHDVTSNPAHLVAAGLLVGFGSVVGGGCTSGHGVCGLARLSRRSLVATATFMLTGVITVFVTRHMIGG